MTYGMTPTEIRVKIPMVLGMVLPTTLDNTVDDGLLKLLLQVTTMRNKNYQPDIKSMVP